MFFDTKQMDCFGVDEHGNGFLCKSGSRFYIRNEEGDIQRCGPCGERLGWTVGLGSGWAAEAKRRQQAVGGDKYEIQECGKAHRAETSFYDTCRQAAAKEQGYSCQVL